MSRITGYTILSFQVGAGAGVSAAQLAAALAAHHSVEYAHLDRLVDTQRGHSRALRQGGARLYAPAVNDPAWPAQWDKRAIGLTPRPDVEALGPGGAPPGQPLEPSWAQTLGVVSTQCTAGQERPGGDGHGVTDLCTLTLVPVPNTSWQGQWLAEAAEAMSCSASLRLERRLLLLQGTLGAHHRIPASCKDGGRSCPPCVSRAH